MKVELISSWGDDNTICNAARVSYNKEASNYTEEQNVKLIKYLIEHKHTSVFRHPQLQFRITCPIYVERQIRKHEIGFELGLTPEPNSSINSISGRYVDFSDSYTKINTWRKQSKSSKQGSEGIVEDQDNCNFIQDEVINFCKIAYEKLLKNGVSKEQARTILPLNLNTTFIWTGSFLSFIHLFNLRLKADVQEETRNLVNEIFNCVKNIDGNPYKYTLKYFNIVNESN
jgi:thymidylate synthase (FAD)